MKTEDELFELSNQIVTLYKATFLEPRDVYVQIEPQPNFDNNLILKYHARLTNGESEPITWPNDFVLVAEGVTWSEALGRLRRMVEHVVRERWVPRRKEYTVGEVLREFNRGKVSQRMIERVEKSLEEKYHLPGRSER